MSSVVLLLDVGNSRVKWALVDRMEWLVDGVSAHDETEKLLHEWDRFPSPARVVAFNVADAAYAQIFSAYWQERKVPLHWMQACQSSAGVRNLYAQPEQLGSDRWAALVGAWARMHRACLVVSAGTAVTVDALNGRGEFIGGLILPGKLMMRKSLVSGTHALEDLSGQTVDFPRNTADAMASGIATALTAGVQTAYLRLASTCPTPPDCILTGGDADWLAKQMQIGVIITPRLVLEGLLVMARGDGQT